MRTQLHITAIAVMCDFIFTSFQKGRFNRYLLSLQSRFLSCVEELRKRADTTDVHKHRLFLILHVAAARAKGHLGSALRCAVFDRLFCLVIH